MDARFSCIRMVRMNDIFDNPQLKVPPYPSRVFKDIRIVLASNSPRRRELLAMIVPQFEIAESVGVDESYPDTLEPCEVPLYLSRIKAAAYKDTLTDKELIITADTVVISDGTVLGKPSTADEAATMLRGLSGKTHTVVTGVTLSSKTGRRSESFNETTEVTFGELSEEEIRLYVDRYAPYDKAGSYGIQEWIGAIGIKGINGCFYNVMGLPLHTLYQKLRNFF